MTKIAITEKQISDMKHAIGYDVQKVSKEGIYNAYRNYFALSKDSDSWNNLVYIGYATKRNQFNDVVYHLTDKGIAYLERILSIKITQND